jgi:hypothetical protein
MSQPILRLRQFAESVNCFMLLELQVLSNIYNALGWMAMRIAIHQDDNDPTYRFAQGPMLLRQLTFYRSQNAPPVPQRAPGNLSAQNPYFAIFHAGDRPPVELHT